MVAIQVLVLNQVQIGWGTQVMIYPLFLLMLPIEMGVFPLMFIAFVTGLIIDSSIDTYGLHTSAALLFAYLRPGIFKLLAPRDGYDALAEPNMFGLGMNWFLKAYGILLSIHLFWYFILELFKLNELLYILQKTILSFVASFLVSILYQYLFLRKSKKNHEV